MEKELTPTQKKIVKLYESRYTWKNIREALDVKDAEIRKTIKMSGIPMRLPNRRRKYMGRVTSQIQISDNNSPKVAIVKQVMDEQVLFAAMLSVRLATAFHEIGQDQAKAFGVEAPSKETVARFIEKLRDKVEP